MQVGRARTRHGAVGVRACTPPKTFSIPTAKETHDVVHQGTSQLAGYQHPDDRVTVPELSPVRMLVTPLLTIPHAYRCAPWPTQWLGCTGGGGRSTQSRTAGPGAPGSMCSPRSLRLSVGLPPSEVRPPVEGVSPSSSEFLFRLCSLPTPRHFETKAIPQQQCSARAAPAMCWVEMCFQASRSSEIHRSLGFLESEVRYLL